MAADMSGEQMQAKITAARREAEGLKDKIRRRKDDLADTNRMSSPLCFSWNVCLLWPDPLGDPALSLIALAVLLLLQNC